MGNRDRIYRIASINKEEASRSRALDRHAYRGRSFDFKAVHMEHRLLACGADGHLACPDRAHTMAGRMPASLTAKMAVLRDAAQCR
ncbi:MAG: hypothetical protein DMF38_10545 [Verrucomicrobia bacterium]|nr:MAG: hypothetical protein DMF38_10545 [Verrucomicrobiota bacterium]